MTVIDYGTVGLGRIFIQGDTTLSLLFFSAVLPSPLFSLPLLPFHLPFPLPSHMTQIGGLGERYKLPSGRFLVNLEHKIKHVTTTILAGFSIN